ncbi:MAG: virulence factor [Paracoccaceae bacterium]|nr:virulence factor [Paracoccaceae bacterium]
MTKLTVLCWQEIPSLVEAKDGSGTHKIELSLKFQELIDLIAMKRGLDGSDDYLMQWGKQKKSDSDAPVKDAAEALAAEIEGNYDQIKADAIANS